MNYNDSSNYSSYLNIPNPQQSIEFSSNQDHLVQELQHSEQQQPKLKEKKKCRGNRKLQRYRRKLRKQGTNSDEIVSSSTTAAITVMTSIDSEPKKDVELKNHQNMETTTSCNINEAIDHRLAKVKNDRISRQRRKNIKMKMNLNEPLDIGEVNTMVSAELLKNKDNSVDCENMPDEIFCQMLSTAFIGTTKLDDYFLNEQDKIDFARHYTGLINRLSYVKLLQEQWDYYYRTGITQNIWTHRIPKHVAEKNSICYTYGRSKTRIQQRRIEIQKQIHLINKTIELFEKEMLLQFEEHTDCSSEIKTLLSMINTFVNEHQQKFRDQCEYERQLLILDATDHQLVQTFFNSNPTKSQVICARHIWHATAKQILLESQITTMQHRLKSLLLSSTNNLFDRMLDDIDEKLTQFIDNINRNSSDSSLLIEFEKLKQFKQDIINQSIQAGRNLIESFKKTVHDEQKKFFIKKNADEHRYNMDVTLLNTVETRRLHMIEREKYITKQTLSTLFKPINSIKENIN